MNKSRQRFVYSLGVLACALPLALSTSSVSKADAEGIFDYSNGASIAYLGGGDLLQKVLPSIDEREVSYLNNDSSLNLSYSETFRSDDVKTSIVDDRLYVIAHEKSYTDNNGRTWTWTPVSIETDPKEMFVLYDDDYVASTSNTSLSNIKVNYQLKLDVSSDVLNSFRNKAYEDVLPLSGVYEKYQADQAYYDRRPASEIEYQQQVAEYEDYLEDYQAYLNKLGNYEAYLVSKAKYNEDLAKYNAYLEAKKQYEEDTIAYQQYLEEYAYYLANHEQNLKEYNEFGIKYINSRYQLSAMRVAFEQDVARDSSMAQYIMSNTVASVLARKDELSVLGVPGDLVDAADSATVKLRTCLREYDDLTNDEARYSYYYINYNYIKSNANILLRSLERLGRYPSVRNVAKDRGKLPQFNTLLFQLIYFCNAVSDTPVYNYEAFNPITGKGDMSKSGAALLDENFQIDGSTYLTWLQGYDFIDTSMTATPKTGILPDKQVDLLPEPVWNKPVPSEPAIVQKPVAPAVVSEPTAPDVVLEPIPYDPTALPPEFPSVLEDALKFNLLEAYLDGNIVERNAFSGSSSILIDRSREVSVSESHVEIAIFHDADYQPIQFAVINNGADYHGEVPTHDPDWYSDEYHFNYWTNELSENPPVVDLGSVDTSMKLYPVFAHGQLTLYTITWIYDEGVETTQGVYGSIPTPPHKATKAETNENYYVFTGWSPALKPVSEDSAQNTYTALFQAKNIFDITYVIDGNNVVNREKEDYLPNPPETLALTDGTYYVVTGWEEDLVKIQGAATYHATFDRYYTITWKLPNQEPYTERYLEGSPVTFKGTIPDPIRGETNYQQFEFDQPLGYATSNRTITAAFVPHPYQSVSLKVDGINVPLNQKYLAEEEVVKPTTYNSSSYHYDISGWTEDGSVYTATFEKTRFIGDGIFFVLTNDSLKVDPSLNDLNEVDLGYLLSLMKANEIQAVPTRIVFEDGEVNLTSTQMSYLALRNANTIGIEFEDLGNNSYSFRVVVKNGSGEEISINDFYPEVTLKKNIDYIHSQVYQNDEEVNAELTYGQVKVRSQINQQYEIHPTYSVSVRSSNAVKATLSQSAGRVGEKIELSYTVQPGYKLKEITARTKGGEVVEIDSKNCLILPADDVVVNFICERLNYTLNLYVDDALYASYSVNYGDSVFLPTYIKKVGDETFEYLFTGWGVTTESIIITEDTNLYAEFVVVEREQSSPKQTSKAVKIAGYVAVGTIGAGLAVGLFFIFRKIIKH